jgi:hypothetical protein
MVIWYIFPRFGMLYQEKSANPVPKSKISLTDAKMAHGCQSVQKS